MSRPFVMLALCMACAGGCGTSYEVPEAQPLEHAAPDTFTIRSFTVNGREMSDGNAGEVPTRGPLKVKAEIEFKNGRPHPPIMHVKFVNEAGDRPVTAGGGIGKLGARTAQGTPFSVETEAPTRPGKYTLQLTAPPAKPARHESNSSGARRPEVYAEGELTVVNGE